MTHKIKSAPNAQLNLSYSFTAKLLAAFVIISALVFGAVLVAALQVAMVKDNIFSLLAVTLFFLPIAILYSFRAIIRQSHLTWRLLGLVRPGWRLLHLLWQAPLLLMALILTQAMVFTITGTEPTRSNTLDDTLFQVNTFLAILMVFSVCILVPIVEEILFRGALYRLLRSHFGILIGALISAVLFATVHLNPILMPYLVTLGIGLALIYEFHKTLWASVIVHALLNSLVTLLVAVALFS